MRLLVFNNYDSFTYNLVHQVEKILHVKVDVYMNDAISLKSIKKYDKIILSPGPGLPPESGLLLPLIQEYASSKSILGICLGHQAIGLSFGGKLENLKKVYHGVAEPLKVLEPESKLFRGMGTGFLVGRYHSWVVSKENLPSELRITAVDEEGQIMAMEHTGLDVKSVQFHPESVLTPTGELLIRNWLKE